MDRIMVSICCTTYNHEKFIRQAIDSFLMQKTNFKYEIIIHDDASTDGTVNIIKEYAKKYPNIIKPIYEKENQYSKGKNPIDIAFKASKGKYIALCEGDDYWCDENKIQKQFDLMQNNKECSMCVHNTKIHDLSNIEKDKNFNDWSEIRELADYDIFFEWNVHTSSYFMKRECASYPKEFWKYWFGDYVYLTMAYSSGKIIFLPDVMSVYNFNNKQGITYKNNEDVSTRISKINCRKQYLEEYNEFTKGKYEKIVSERISEIEFEILSEEILYLPSSLNKFKEKRKSIRNNKYYKKYLKQLGGIKKIKFYAKHNLYIANKIYRKLKNVIK